MTNQLLVKGVSDCLIENCQVRINILFKNFNIYFKNILMAHKVYFHSESSSKINDPILIF